MSKKNTMEAAVIKKAAATLKTIGHPVRLRVIEILEQHKKLTVNEMLKWVDVDQATLSKHLAVLRTKQIVTSEADKNYRYYAIQHPHVVNILDCIRKHA
jgi:DNA-binding transcriptional ArsR family regulator